MQTSATFFHSVRRGEIKSGSIPEELRPDGLDAGYQVQSELVDRILESEGGSLVGYKAACTNVHAQELLSTDAPVFGRLLSSSSWRSGQSLSIGSFPMVVLESEFSFNMAKDVPVSGPSGAAWTRDTILPHVGDMMPAMELVGHGFDDWACFDAPTLAADNAIHLGWVHGSQTSDWREIDLAECEVRLFCDETAVRSGSGRNVLGHPLNVIAWLANTLPRYGLRLREGDRVLTGVSTDIFPVEAGGHIRADFGSLGSVELTLEE